MDGRERKPRQKKKRRNYSKNFQDNQQGAKATEEHKPENMSFSQITKVTLHNKVFSKDNKVNNE